MNSTCQKRGYFWAFTKLLLFANCWSANKFWSASIVAGVFSLRNCGWLVERFFFCYPEDVLGEQYVTSSWTLVMSWQFRFCSVAPVTMSRWHRLSLWSPVTMSSWHRLSLWTPVTMSRWHRLSLSLSELLSPCHGLPLGQSFVSYDRGGGPLQDEDHYGSRPHSFPGLY